MKKTDTAKRAQEKRKGFTKRIGNTTYDVSFHILSDLKPYTPDGFVEPRPAEKSKVLTTAQALSLLKQRGMLSPTLLPLWIRCHLYIQFFEATI